jgi:hypothetical protein
MSTAAEGTTLSVAQLAEELQDILSRLDEKTKEIDDLHTRQGAFLVAHEDVKKKLEVCLCRFPTNSSRLLDIGGESSLYSASRNIREVAIGDRSCSTGYGLF